jgi:hypothetical protein
MEKTKTIEKFDIAKDIETNLVDLDGKHNTFGNSDLGKYLHLHSNTLHLIHVLAGYRALIMEDEELQPYSPGSARQYSFDVGVKMAKEELKTKIKNWTPSTK